MCSYKISRCHINVKERLATFRTCFAKYTLWPGAGVELAHANCDIIAISHEVQRQEDPRLGGVDLEMNLRMRHEGIE